MDLSFLEQNEYIMDAWSKSVANNPNALILTDERHPRGISRRKADELSGRIYGWLHAKGIGREDFVLICMPRGGMALLSYWVSGRPELHSRWLKTIIRLSVSPLSKRTAAARK